MPAPDNGWGDAYREALEDAWTMTRGGHGSPRDRVFLAAEIRRGLEAGLIQPLGPPRRPSGDKVVQLVPLIKLPTVEELPRRRDCPECVHTYFTHNDLAGCAGAHGTCECSYGKATLTPPPWPPCVTGACHDPAAHDEGAHDV